jgi:hypothetical protein
MSHPRSHPRPNHVIVIVDSQSEVICHSTERSEIDGSAVFPEDRVYGLDVEEGHVVERRTNPRRADAVPQVIDGKRCSVRVAAYGGKLLNVPILPVDRLLLEMLALAK